jgi:hypothetical protein
MPDMYRVNVGITGVQGDAHAAHYFDVGGGDPADCPVAIAAFYNAIKGLVGSGTSWNIEAGVDQVVDEDGRIVAVHPTTAVSVAATGSGQIMPLATQLLVQWRTGAYSEGREIRGRTFIPNPLVGGAVGSFASTSTQSTINSAAAALIADADTVLVVYRRERQAAAQVGSPGLPGYRPAHTHRDGSFAPVTVGACWNKYAVLRSRRD